MSNNHHFSKTKPPLFLLLGFITTFLICCGAPIPHEYKTQENQQKLLRYTEDSTTIDGLQCDGIVKYDFVIGPKEECFIHCDVGNCPVVVKQERFLSTGGLDINPIHIKLDTLMALDTNSVPFGTTTHTMFHHMSYSIIRPKNEYFKITIYCVDMLDGKCEPRVKIKRK